MVDNVDIVNWALQKIGDRTTITAAQLATNANNQAKQANLVLTQLRDEVIRMAPWNSATNTANMVYVTSQPGTPENTSSGSTLWQKGLPSPPWVYEYQYPVDCLRPLFVIPQWQTGFGPGPPITTAVTGGAATWWNAPPQRFKVGIDQFYPVTAAAVANGGTGANVGDVITLAGTTQGNAPIGAPVQLLVLTAPAGVIGTVSVVNQISGSSTPQGGSYFAAQTNPVAQGSTTGSGVGATFNLTFGSQGSQRVILCNQEFAILTYLKQITDPNVMDPELQDAWASILAARLAMALPGDKTLANMKITEANNIITQARKDDGNEGLTINDVVPDWIRVRGFDANYDSTNGPYGGFDWGNSFPMY